jgi:hypothetical protein
MPGGPGLPPPNNPTKTTVVITRHPCYVKIESEPRAIENQPVPQCTKHKEIKALLAFCENYGHELKTKTAALCHFALTDCGGLTN